MVPYEHAKRLSILPLGILTILDEPTLTVAVAPAYPHDLVAELRFATNHQIKLLPTPRMVVQRAIHSAYLGNESHLQERISSLRELEKIDCPALHSKPELRVTQGDVAQLLTALIDYAIARNASDIHLLPLRDGGYVRIRVRGELLTHDRSYCNLENHSKIIARLKVLAALDTTQRALPQDGSFTIPVNEREIFARINIMPTLHGEKAVIRLMNSSGILTLSELGLSPAALSQLQKHSARSEGAILFAGPTGSGKSTTMYALLHELANRNLSISTIEDPVEIQLDAISQTSIDERRGLTYANCLRSILRQDPDVILLGELRDEESARIALQAAVTGHILLTTLHARNVLEVFTRLKALGSDPLTIAQSLRLIVCQRLLPTLCSKCKVIDLEASNTRGKGELFKAVGCSSCDYSGFAGSALVTETLEMHQRLHEIITADAFKNFKSTELNSEFFVPLQGGLDKLLVEGAIPFSEYLAHSYS